MPKILQGIVLESRNTKQADFAVSYDLHDVEKGKDDHKVVRALLRKLTKRREGDVSGVTRKRPNTVWNIDTTMDRDQLYDCIIRVLTRAKRKHLLTAKSVTLLVVRVDGKYRAAKKEL